MLIIVLEQRELDLCVAENRNEAQVLNLLRDVQFLLLFQLLELIVGLLGIRSRGCLV